MLEPAELSVRRLISVTGSLAIAVGVVIVVAAILPDVPGWTFPVILVLLTAAFVVVGRTAARAGRTFAARAFAGWAGVAASLGAFGWTNLLGFGGALVAALLVVIAINAALAFWFRSGVHFAVTIVLGLVWGVLAHVFATPPWAAVALAVAGLWWLGAIGASRSVAVVTTLALPISVVLLVHPLVGAGAAIDAADVAVVAGLTALAVLLPGVVTRREVRPAVWPIVRRTAVIALLVQVLGGTVPAVGEFLTPERPFVGLFGGAACVLAAVAVAAARRTRPGVWTVLVLAALLVAEIAAAVLLGQTAASIVGLVGVAVVLVVWTVRARSVRLLPAAVVGVLAIVGALLLVTGAAWPIAAGIVLVLGVVLLLGASRPKRVTLR